MKNALAALAAVLSLGYGPAVACPDGEHHQQTRFRAPPTALTLPSRPLVWGELNIIHTTDTHGWLLGHQKSSPPEPNYSGTFGDFASFVFHMNETAKKKGADLLLVDTGDLHDGTGLSDGYPPGEWDGEDSDEFFARLPYDLLTIGNHELYTNVVAQDMHANFTKKFPGRYLTSNAYITVTDAHNKSQTVPIGWQYAKFKTRKGRRVTALGVIFNARNLASDVTVHPAKAMATETWFTDLIKESPDFFLLIGHMPVRGDGDSWNFVFDPIRNLHKDTPIIVLGGHTHIRDCVQYDQKSIALESGAFMDTVGWLSVNLTSPSGNPSFSRRYLDPNRATYKYHTTHHKFDTRPGLNITDGLKKLFEKYNLGKVWGKSPQDYTLFRDPTTSNRSVLKMFVEEALPMALSDVPSVAAYRYFVIGIGVLRYDVFQGTFDQNDQLTASPYPDQLWCIPNVPLKDAEATGQKMNQKSSSATGSFSESEPHHARRRDLMEVDQTRLRWLAEMNNVGPAQMAENLTLGYVTQDKCGTQKPGDGDDTPHTPVAFVTEFPSVVSSQPPKVADDTHVDLVFLDFHKTRILQALNSVQTQKTYAEKDIRKDYTTIQTKDVLGIYAEKKWKN
ncbi:Metallo-dependent phosphatase-like protein [Russula ochroleuca]|uniref:Metallo-dependent phosphatase-like protein n=1 Tax=Russula ochroleuca TaxID=152965 RepID=A0A9P5N1L8_9AGAM|nr:Metallo-dependent phosphatase-like protein [Russula ochroleuca]